MLKFNVFSDCISFYIYQSITQIVVAYVCFAVLSRRHLTQHRHLTIITSQLQTHLRIAPSFIYNRRCHFNDFQENNRIGINYYIEDESEDIEQFQFSDKGLLTPTSNNLIIIIVSTVVVKYFQKSTFCYLMYLYNYFKLRFKNYMSHFYNFQQS